MMESEFIFIGEPVHWLIMILITLLLLYAFVYIFVNYRRFLFGDVKNIFLKIVIISFLTMLLIVFHLIEELFHHLTEHSLGDIMFIAWHLVFMLIGIYFVVLANKFKHFADVYGFVGIEKETKRAKK